MADPEETLLREGGNCWRIEPSDRFSFIVDAAEYFVAVRKAMLGARHSILLIGWDFDPRIELGKGDDGGPTGLGDFILWLADRTPSLEIRLLRWDTGAFKSFFRGGTLITILRWMAHDRITLKLDSAHPVGSAHHQKIVSIDDKVAFCGGIDMTSDRWDTREHKDDDPRRIGPGGETHAPWHDATSVFDGPAAAAMGDLARARWKAATGVDLAACPECETSWPDGLAPTVTNVRLAIARTAPKMEGVEPVHEIESAYLDLIATAKRHIYAESQYFASRKIALAIAKRLAEDDPPEIVIVNPVTAEGVLEPLAMDTARARLVEALRRIDRHGRLRLYHPRTQGGQEIYVHAKVMVVDDRILRVGSSNFNNRSLRLDTECDVILSADSPGEDALRLKIERLRNDLLAEHLGVEPEVVAARLEDCGSLIATIEALRGGGRSLAPYVVPDLTTIEAWLAENEILDPNGPDDMFESTENRGLFKGWGRLRRGLRRVRKGSF